MEEENYFEDVFFQSSQTISEKEWVNTAAPYVGQDTVFEYSTVFSELNI